MDLALAVPDDAAAEAIVFDLQSAGYRALASVEQETTHRLATTRLAPAIDPAEGLMLDLLFASSGIEHEICKDEERVPVFPRCTLPVARLHHLIALKVLARDDRARPQDAANLRQLIQAAQPSDLDAAQRAVALITSRGFNRGRDLDDALRRACEEFGHRP